MTHHVDQKLQDKIADLEKDNARLAQYVEAMEKRLKHMIVNLADALSRQRVLSLEDHEKIKKLLT